MPLIAGWDGSRLDIYDEKGERQFVFEAPGVAKSDSGGGEAVDGLPDDAARPAVSALALGSVDAPLTACLLPAEMLLQRPFSLPFEHPRYIDAATLAQELADQAGAEEEDWWLCWQAERVDSGVRGLVFALPGSLKHELTAAAISSPCPYIGPDIAVRLRVHQPQGNSPAGVLDADADGLMLGVYADGVWCGMRRLNLGPGRSMASLAHEALASLKAMGFDAASMPLTGRLDTAWKQVFDTLPDASRINWQVEIPASEVGQPVSGLPGRQAANALAMHAAGMNAPFNFRHGAWAVQTDWSKRIGPWRRTAVLLAVLVLLMIGHDSWQLHQLQSRQDAARSAIEAAFHQALPGVAMIDPMLQLRQAAGGGASADAWKFIRQMEAITQLGRQEQAFKPQAIVYADGEVMLSGAVPDIAAANRIRDALGSILGRKVDLLDTDLGDQQVRIRLRWAS
ncbi:MAG: hypothetical protein COS82_11335 [Zetaproteobacteria bacterium CG06_land_8_20_14_3_00_59_53]|nr:MAG: hypothetical protein AUK36_00995 [Zetaproteobacteria bacterium CG2_30_59_37]PIO90091.1 MAG: hypothetical protein COX56_04540 [Zetaproteobacteria bacterium CG23_combo_of_CG06-09_8_20_14_all_59_86]PIQ64812.1 MAG: hypothetical protein COV97_07010 [Zetaproteobacteria bacterium CG11_big_fil_rev_8_21_14_0_20_59_439]PIU69491.1 MAG: hypothetical protein COS82_11335 [Zetaproteobacteria bacterium CG06_land_8_20_14_3_00_59_53]PIU96756.1 MAG: hypothetical protein COS62_07065 [Zetaproteobacteria bac